jgi:hypothetical protein
VAQSTQHLTVLKPTALIWSKSLPQRSALVESSGSSMGARALPPEYHTATGKKGCEEEVAGAAPGLSAALASQSARTALGIPNQIRFEFSIFI